MADFTRYHITNAGRQLTAKMSGQTKAIEFTKFETSDHKYDEEDLQTLTTLESVKQTGNVNSTEYEEPYVWKIKGSVSTVELEAGYFLQTVGIYAREEGEAGTEILFAVTTTKDAEKADWVSENGAMNTSEITFVANFIVTDANVTSVIVNADGFTPSGVFLEHQQKSTSVHGSTTQPTPNRIVERDGEGAANVKYPVDPTDDSVVNKKALEERLTLYTTEGVNKTNIVNYYREGVTYNQNDVVGIETQYVNPMGQSEEVNAILFYKCLENNVTESPVGSSKWEEIKTGGDLDKNFIKAEEVFYSSTKSGLSGVIGYEFPKDPQILEQSYSGKFGESNKADGNYTLQKQDEVNNSHYLLTGTYTSSGIYYKDGLLLTLHTFNGKTDFYEIVSYISQFFDFSNAERPTFKDAQSSIAISEVSEPLKYCFVIYKENASSKAGIYIKRKDDIPLSSVTSYSVTLNVKNEVLKNLDTYLPVVTNQDFEFFRLKFEPQNEVFRLTGEIKILSETGSAAAIQAITGSPYLQKYFNDNIGGASFEGITSTIEGDKIAACFYGGNTIGFVSTLSKPVPAETTIIFNRTPDKNYMLSPKYSPAKDVQNAIDILTNKIEGYNPDVARRRNLIDVLNAKTVKEAFFKLREKVSQGDFSNINLGDYILIDFNIGDASYDRDWKEKLKVVVMAFNHYKNLYSNGNNTQNHIVLQFENIIVKKRMHSGHIAKFWESELYSYLNGTFLTELQKVIGIEPYNFYISTNNYNSTGDWKQSKIWVPSQVEVFGNIGGRGFIFQTPSYVYYNAPAQTQFALYAKEPWRKTKFDKNSDSRMWWWMRDVDQHTTGNFCSVNYAGNSNYYGVTIAGGVAPVFCI